jgi:DNA-binding MarR family transcriptional regulator
MARFGTAYTRFLRTVVPPVNRADGAGSYPRLRVLSALGDGARRTGVLARDLGLTSHAVTKLVDALVSDGLLERRPDPTDRRASLVALTDRGREACDRLQPDHAAAAASAFEVLTDGERDMLVTLIDKVTRHINEISTR